LANSISWTEKASTRYGSTIRAEHPRNTGQLVYSVAETSDLALVAGEHVQVTHLHHGLREPQSPRSPVARVQVHKLRRVVLAPADQRDVRRKEHLARLHVLVVLVVEQQLRLGVQVHHTVPPAGRCRAPPPERPDVGGVHVDRDLRVQPEREGRAVGAAEGVRAGERDHVVGGEVLGGEAVDELRRVGEGRGQVIEHVGDVGDAPVAPPRRHGEVDAAQDPRGVARRERNDVGAGYGMPTPPLQDALRAVDDVEPAQAGVVRLRRLLHARGVAAGGGVQQHRRVTPLKHNHQSHMDQLASLFL
jgi:hypothetical protein